MEGEVRGDGEEIDRQIERFVQPGKEGGREGEGDRWMEGESQGEANINNRRVKI